MGGDDSQKLLLWRGNDSPLGHSKPPAHLQNQQFNRSQVELF
jgi:hypothetical protein